MQSNTTLIDVPAEALGLPSEDKMSSDSGLVENHLYEDVRGWKTGDFRRFAKAEKQILDYLAEGGDLESEDAYMRFEENEAWTSSIDPGLIGTVIALSVVGCCPVTSCVGSVGHHEGYPLVAFWCPAASWPTVRAAAEHVGVSVTWQKLVDGGTLLIAYHESSWRPLHALGFELVARWPDTGSVFPE